jgi:hypothetical protein
LGREDVSGDGGPRRLVNSKLGSAQANQAVAAVPRTRSVVSEG